MKCRFCGEELHFQFIDLANSPPSNSFLKKEELDKPEIYYPLKLYVCSNCFLVQIGEFITTIELFNNNYAYFSSYSDSWLNHCKNYSEMIIKKLKLGEDSNVIEIASNDGYLLQYFMEKKIPVLGIEPAENTANASQKKGINTIIKFFDIKLANEIKKNKKQADLVIGNNVLAHVNNLNDFIKGLKIILKQNGIINLEFPHLAKLIGNNQFDTIYHEHFSYFSFTTVNKIFDRHDLKIFDVEEIKTHGGSLRLYICHGENNNYSTCENVNNLLEKEELKSMNKIEYYLSFQKKADKIKLDFLSFILDQKKINKKIAGYGAAAKGNTLLNYCGIKNDLIDFVADKSIHKQGKYLPGSHIPVYDETFLKKEKPDFIIILPWNIKEEIINQLNYISQWGGRFVIPIPKLEII